MKTKQTIVQYNKDGRVIRQIPVKTNETPSDRLLNALLNKDIVLIDGDTVSVEAEAAV